jgi:cob(I)alamin adenosyltransferase
MSADRDDAPSPRNGPADTRPDAEMDADAWRGGRVQLYTGDGKGKTTAALGLALRAAGAGLAVRILQFCKPAPTSEAAALLSLPADLRLETAGAPGWIRPGAEDFPVHRDAARRGVERAGALLGEDGVRVVVLDEFATAVALGLLSREEAEALLAARPGGVELILTGRGAPEWLLAAADLVTEMRAVRHYAETGLPARRGIEY